MALGLSTARWPAVRALDSVPAVTGRTGAVLVALAVALTGCTSAEPRPPALPPAPSVSPTLAPLPLPPEAAAETAEGAAAFARYYLQVIAEAFAAGDSTVLRMTSAPGCGGCDALISSVENLQRQGRKRVGGDYQVKSALAPAVIRGDVIVDVTYERSAASIVDSAGQVFATAAPVPVTSAQLRLLYREAGWAVQGYRVGES